MRRAPPGSPLLVTRRGYRRGVKFDRTERIEVFLARANSSRHANLRDSRETEGPVGRWSCAPRCRRGPTTTSGLRPAVLGPDRGTIVGRHVFDMTDGWDGKP